MIIHTKRAHEVAEWIDANCERSTYALEEGSFMPLVKPKQKDHRADTNITERITVNLHPDDRVMFDLFFHGWFIKHPVHDRYHDDTEINRMLLALYQDVGG